MRDERLNKLLTASLFLALGILIPFVFHYTGLDGRMFLPMHIAVLLCGVVCGEGRC